MDWTMISNADNTVDRIKTVYYLFVERYQTAPAAAAHQLIKASESNADCKALVDEIKGELTVNTQDLSLGKLASDQQVRQYFREMLEAQKFEDKIT